MPTTARAGAVFTLMFVAALVASVGELAGSFADPDHVFVDRFADSGNRTRDIAGSYLLGFAAVTFAWFALALSRDAAPHRAALLLAGGATGAGMLLAAVAWATVPMSLWFGSLVDDPGLQQGAAVLPQFGYVALTMGAMLPAAVFALIVARTPGLVPRWLSVASYPVAALVAFTAVLFMPLFAFLAWVVTVAVTRWRRPAAAE